jgi:tRNA(fMet)-specific endonuclease VapC
LKPRFLLDTNVVSERLRPRPDAKLLRLWDKHESEIATAAPVWHELLYGCFLLPPSRKREVIEQYLRDVVLPTILVLPYDAGAAEWHARERARLAGRGKTPSFVDGQIAAVAWANDLVIVSANTSDFSSFQGVEVQDWRA